MFESFQSIRKGYCWRWQETGYTTRSLYSCPVTVRGSVLAVLQFLNKEEVKVIINETQF